MVAQLKLSPMKGNLLLTAFTFLASVCTAQNFSGLQNKKLNRIDDLGFLLESQIGSLLGGRIEGDVDSVTITWDSEKTLKGKIWYREYLNGFFTISVMDAGRQKQNGIVSANFTQGEKPSPAEFTLEMAESVPKGTLIESPYLRIDISKRSDRSGKVKVFALNKNWKNELDPQNVVLDVPLMPVGKAATLTNTPKDATPSKNIRFDPNIYFKPKVTDTRFIRTGGGNFFRSYGSRSGEIDISGTWVNTDANTSGITRLIVTGNNIIQGFGRCSPQDCDWGKVTLTSLGPANFRAIFSWSFKRTTLSIHHSGSQLIVTSTDSYKDGRPSRSTDYTFRKNISTAFVKPRLYTLTDVSKISTGGGTVDKTPRGPDKNVQIYLLDGLAADVDFSRPQDISNININVFADKNLNSGYYYILPADYHLKWEPRAEAEKGYEFRILYGSQDIPSETAPGTEAPVRMSASLTAGISSREREFVKELLRAARADFRELRYLPLRENPQFTFQNTLGAQYNIPPEKISIETSTDLSNDIRVAWQTDADTKEFIETALTSREGVSASVILKPEDENILDQLIPASINLADTRTLGKMTLEPMAWRTRNWRNTTPYPLRLRYLHVLKKAIGGSKPIIYSWTLNDLVVPAQAQVKFDHSRIPTWLDTDASAVMWLDYEVEDCRDCDMRVMDAVTDAVFRTKTQNVRLTIPPAVFDTLNASYFLVTLRSMQADPRSEQVRELPSVRVYDDLAREFLAGPLFIPSGGSLEYEFRITIATRDGDFYTATDWSRSTEPELLLGKTQLKEMFRGIIPGLD